MRDQKGVTVNDILHAAGTIDDEEKELKSEIVTKVVLPVLSPAEQAFGHVTRSSWMTWSATAP